MTSWPERAREIAEQVLFPAANAVDADGEIPTTHFEALAAEGFYGLAAGSGGGPELHELPEIFEVLCGACLATTFTWMQHNGVVMSLTGTANAGLRERFLNDLVDGSVKAGVAFAGAIPRPPKLYARQTDSGYVLDGSAPFVTGWNIVDVLQVSARDEFDDSLVHAVIPATADSRLGVEHLSLIAANASNTVRLRFDGLEVDNSSVVSVVSDAQFQAGQLYGSWINGCMATGIARRAIATMDELGVDTADFRAEHGWVRERFDDALAGREEMFRARAYGSELAVRCAAALVTATGSSALTGHGTAERLMREATFTLVAAGRPAIRTALLDTLARTVQAESDEQWR